MSEDTQSKLQMFQSIYKGVKTGFGISEEEKDVVNSAGGSDTYGELEPLATLQLLEALQLDKEDVFVDLGCGTGKILVLAALCSDAGRSLGFELSETRVEGARQAIIEAGVEDRCGVFAEDFVKTPLLEDATVCYSCNYTLPKDSLVELFARFSLLPKLRLVVTFKHPFICLPTAAQDEFAKSFKAAGSIYLHCSWAKHVKVFLYSRRR